MEKIMNTIIKEPLTEHVPFEWVEEEFFKLNYRIQKTKDLFENNDEKNRQSICKDLLRKIASKNS